MNLRTQAEADLGEILEDGVYGFGWPITVTDPAGTVGNLVGFSNDVALSLDPDTGVLVTSRIASAALRISSLTAAGLGLPVNIADPKSKPWVIEFTDINGNAGKFKVNKSSPDRALGIVVCVLGAYE